MTETTKTAQTAKTPKHPVPWWADAYHEFIVIRDSDGVAVCIVPRTDAAARADEDSLADLLALAPELHARLHALVEAETRCAADLKDAPEDFNSLDDYDFALDDATALLGLLAESGCQPGAFA